MTARREQWEGLHCLPLEGLPRERSRELLAEARQGLSPDDPELNAIAKTLGDLPLALTLAAAYLREMAHRAPAQYLEALRACRRQREGRAPSSQPSCSVCPSWLLRSGAAINQIRVS
mgnify:FL=1